jgi:hypothetical protein
MLPPLASIWDIVVPPTAILTTVVAIAIATIVMAVIVTVAAAFLATTGIVTVIPMVVIAVTATAIGARLPLVVIRPIIADAEAIPEVHPEAVALLVRQGISMPPKTPIIGKFFCVYVALCSHAWYPDERLWRGKVEVSQTRRVSVFKSNHPSVLSFQSLLQ